MKRILFLLLILSGLNCIYAQWDLSLNMGLDFKSAPSYRDYINYNHASTSADLLSTFKSSPCFGGEVDYKLNTNFALGLEYNFQIDSYNTNNGSGGSYQLSYNLIRPSLLAYYVLSGEGYQFKFGGGAGLRYVSLSETISGTTNYTATGVGFLIKTEGNTKLSDHFYALIGVNIRYDITGKLTNPSLNLINPASNNENVNLNSISFGIYFGITFIL
jgi:Outer membrane protein beta-barrel domain